MYISRFLAVVLSMLMVLTPEMSYAQSLFVSQLPEPGTMVGVSSSFTPVLVKGMVIHPDKPFDFDFIVNAGSLGNDPVVIKNDGVRSVKYFLAAITVPEAQLWVNLSPYEKDRVMENDLSQTLLGRDMLAQDYLLKQITASLINPEKGLGKEFWAKVYEQSQAKFGTTDIPVDTFNKVWIMPDKAEVFEKGNAVYVTQARLKVMLDTDYVAMNHDVVGARHGVPEMASLRPILGEEASPVHSMNDSGEISKNILREIILPALEKEVNEGENFAAIRQVYHAAILAKWYRELIKSTFMGTSYVGQNKVAGVLSDEKQIKDEIYQRYVAAYKQGVFNYIKEDVGAHHGMPEMVSTRHYFSGGEVFSQIQLVHVTDLSSIARDVDQKFNLKFRVDPIFKKADHSMMTAAQQEALDYQEAANAKMERLSREAQELFDPRVTDADRFKERKIAGAGKDGVFQAVSLADMQRVKWFYADVQEGVRGVLGQNSSIMNVALDKIHLTIAPEGFQVGPTPFPSFQEVVDEVSKDIGQSFGAFDIRLLGPRLMPDGAVIMEFEITDPKFLYLRKRAQQRQDQRKAMGISSESVEIRVPDIFHSTVSLVTDTGVSQEHMKALFEYLERYRANMVPIDIKVRQIAVIQGIGKSRSYSKIEQLPLDQNDASQRVELENPHINSAVEKLVSIRSSFARGDYQSQQDNVNQVLKDLTTYMADYGVTQDSPVLSLYYLAKVMVKAVKASKFLFIEGGERRPTQVMLIDEEGREVLLQQRGPYKRLFADKQAIAVNVSKSEGPASVARAIKDELGLDVDMSRLTIKDQEYTDNLVALDLYALTDQENEDLKSAVEKISAEHHDPVNGVSVEYDPLRRSAIVYSLKPNVLLDKVKAVAALVQDLSKVPYMYPVNERMTARLAIYRFNHDEKAALLKQSDENTKKRYQALSRMNKGGYAAEQLGELEKDLVAWDSDSMIFSSIENMLASFEESPSAFALDLMLPYLQDSDLWRDMAMAGQYVVPVNSRLLGDTTIVGAKGANLKRLQLLARKIEGLKIPKTSAVSREAFEDLVLRNKEISALIHQLNPFVKNVWERTENLEKVESAILKLGGKKPEEKAALKYKKDQFVKANVKDQNEIRGILKLIRDKIRYIELPDVMKAQVRMVFYKLGGNIAVRSSANAEDIEGFSASGLGESFVNVTKIEDVYTHIKDVWASLYSDGFMAALIKRRNKADDVRMPVVLQQFIDAKAAGVINTYDVSSFRTVYKIVGNWGLGESVVQGEGKRQDKWIVGLSPRDEFDILEKSIGPKNVFVVADAGLQTRKINLDDVSAIHDDVYDDLAKKNALPSLIETDVLRLAQQVEQIHRVYKKKGWADQIDLEYAQDKNGDIYIVQTRPLNVDSDSKEKVSVEVVDEDALPVNVIKVSLDGVTAQVGVVVAPLLVTDKIPSSEESFKKIIVTGNTNNQWNEVFHHFGGVITQQGMEVAHATNNSRENRIPCVVGASDAIQLLNSHNGEVVTFDAYHQKIYIGEVRTKTIEIEKNVWVNREDVEALRAQQKAHELKRPFVSSMQEWPAVFKQYFDGNLRRRSAHYTTFQIDYYYVTWDRLTKYLNEKYKDRRPFELKTQKRVIRDEGLFNQIVDDDTTTIYYFLAGLKDLSIQDMWDLYNDRMVGLDRFVKYFQDLKTIDAENIEQVMDELVEGFKWMHVAYWLGAVDYELFIIRQSAYMDYLFYPKYQNAAVGSLDDKYLVNLSKERDMEVEIVLERLRRNPDLRTLQDASSVQVFADFIKNVDPLLHQRIASWSNIYKRGQENIELIDETDEYYQILYNNLKVLKSTKDRENEVALIASSVRMAFRLRKVSLDTTMEVLKSKHPDLYYFVSSYVRSRLVEQEVSAEQNRTERHSIWLMNNIDPEVIDSHMQDEFNKIVKVIQEQMKKDKEYLHRIKEYPQLLMAMQLDKVERTLREDGHHYAIRAQRPLAKAMLKAAEQMPFFKSPDEVFLYGIEELIEIFKTGGNDVIKKSVHWRDRVREADNYMWRVWGKFAEEYEDSRELAHLLSVPYHRYLVAMYQVMGMINEQRKKTRLKRLQDWYLSEITRIRQRVADTKVLLDQMEVFNSLQFTKDKERAFNVFRESEQALDKVVNNEGGAFFSVFQKGIEHNRQLKGEELAVFFPTQASEGINAVVEQTISIAKKELSSGNQSGLTENIFIHASDAFIQLAFYERSKGALRSDFDEVKRLVSENAVSMDPFVVKLIGPRLMKDGFIVLEYEIMSPKIDALRRVIKKDIRSLERRSIEMISNPIANERIKQSTRSLSFQEEDKIREEAFKEVQPGFESFNAGVPEIYHSTIGVLKDRSISQDDLVRLRQRFHEIREDIAFQRPQIFLIDSLVLADVDVKDRRVLKSLKMSLSINGNGRVISDDAMSSDLGGIDISNINLKSTGLIGEKADIKMSQYLLDQGFNGFVPVLMGISPINDIMPLFQTASGSGGVQ
ncbi:MAG: PEP/pyruvate-binding domain-containing protein [Candidatus Omnitrophota bacterium]